MLLMIDNYDSFTYNLVQYFGELGADVRVYRNDQISVQQIEELQPDQIVMLNPGRTCGALEVRQVIAENGGPADAVVVEAQTLVYACRRNATEVHVFGLKDEVACAGDGGADRSGRRFKSPAGNGADGVIPVNGCPVGHRFAAGRTQHQGDQRRPLCS